MSPPARTAGAKSMGMLVTPPRWPAVKTKVARLPDLLASSNRDMVLISRVLFSMVPEATAARSNRICTRCGISRAWQTPKEEVPQFLFPVPFIRYYQPAPDLLKCGRKTAWSLFANKQRCLSVSAGDTRGQVDGTRCTCRPRGAACRERQR